MILIVDDCGDSSKALVHLLKRQGYRAQCVSSGPAALAAMIEEPPQLVILDQNMPGQTGIEILQHMRQDVRLSQVRVLFFSADLSDHTRYAALSAGAAGWIEKGPNGWRDILASAQANCPVQT